MHDSAHGLESTLTRLHCPHSIVQGLGKVLHVAFIETRYRYPRRIRHVDVVFLYEICQCSENPRQCMDVGLHTFEIRNLRRAYARVSKHATLLDQMRPPSRSL